MTAQQFTEDERAAFRKSGRMGGLTFAATTDVFAHAARARAGQAAGYLIGHGPCKACGPRIEIPEGVTQEERERRAAVLKRRHHTAIADMRHAAARATREAPTR